MKSILVHTLMALLLICLTGCATGSGINRHAFFEPKAPPVLPFRIEVDKQTESTEVGQRWRG